MRLSFLRMGFSILLLAGSGCELIADFDRSKIPGAEMDSGMPPEDDAGEDDAGNPDAATDAAPSDDGGNE